MKQAADLELPQGAMRPVTRLVTQVVAGGAVYLIAAAVRPVIQERHRINTHGWVFIVGIYRLKDLSRRMVGQNDTGL